MSNEVPVSHSLTAAERILSESQAHVRLANGRRKQENVKEIFPILSEYRLVDDIAFRKLALRTIHEIEEAERIAQKMNGSISPAVHTFLAFQKKRVESIINRV